MNTRKVTHNQKIIMTVILLCTAMLNEVYPMELAKALPLRNGNGSPLHKTKNDPVKEAFEKMLEKSTACKIFSLPLLKLKLDSADAGEKIKEWLATDQGSESFVEAVYTKYRKRIPRSICFIKIGLIFVELHPNVKKYLSDNPGAKDEVERKYFHHLLSNATTPADIEYYHELGLSLSSVDGNGFTWLIGAVMKNLEEVAAFLIARRELYGIDIHACDKEEGKNALCYALMAQSINISLIETLWRAGICVPEGFQQLLAGIGLANQSSLLLLIEDEYRQWKKAFQNAIVEGFLDDIKALLAKDNAKQFISRKDFRPLHWAIENKQQLIIRFLLKEFPGLKGGTDEFGMTPLHWAASMGDIQTVNSLIALGVNREIPDTFKRTPLQWAIQEKHTNVIQALGAILA